MFNIRDLFESALRGFSGGAAQQAPQQQMGAPRISQQMQNNSAPMRNLNDLQVDQATGGRYQGGLRNMQPQAYSTRQLYGTPMGSVPARNPQMGLNRGYIQNGGVPTMDGGLRQFGYGIAEDAYGGNLNNYLTDNLRVR